MKRPDVSRGSVEQALVAKARAGAELVTGFSVDRAGYEQCLRRVETWLTETRQDVAGGRYFVCANPHSLEMARADPQFARAIEDADLVIPDGIGVVLASRLAGGAIRERVTGTMLFLGVSGLLNARGGSVYFLGSAQPVLERITSRLSLEYPRIRIVGAVSPPFAPSIPPDVNDRIVNDINAARPDVVWVGMTAPKQEKWIHQNRALVHAGLLGPIGGAFDFYAGTVTRSSPWFRDHGLEWLPRLLRDPRRLWRRSFVSAPRFLSRALLDARFRRKDS